MVLLDQKSQGGAEAEPQEQEPEPEMVYEYDCVLKCEKKRCHLYGIRSMV
jgi:hypothetical protein